jgi:hypothetical protein
MGVCDREHNGFLLIPSCGVLRHSQPTELRYAASRTKRTIPLLHVPEAGMFPMLPANSGPLETNLSQMRIDDLRDAIHQNQVTFPSQVPTFAKHDRPDLQRKLVQLYFALDWSCPKIGVR